LDFTLVAETGAEKSNSIAKDVNQFMVFVLNNNRKCILAQSAVLSEKSRL
jgi:hypothetical protein